MPLFEKRKREAPPSTPSVEQVKEAVGHYTTIRRLWQSGRIDLAILGDVGESEVFVNMADVHGQWLRVAAQAWHGYERQGRGFLFLDGDTRELTYFTPESVPPWLPEEIVPYCASYDPRTDLVMVIHGFPETDDPEGSACLWLRPPETWITPPVAWRQWEQTRA